MSSLRYQFRRHFGARSGHCVKKIDGSCHMINNDDGAAQIQRTRGFHNP
jgi:hypothetical protein